MKNSAYFCHKAQLPERGRLAVIVFPLLNQLFDRPSLRGFFLPGNQFMIAIPDVSIRGE
ncbi:hypothetical protein [Photorhabdus namnaonensis]|uniref:Uncharacterized protein n=1 Tax=Photorhabdus namnaonensis TaxID=1851568 RepID=A0A1B8YBP0_9GAMM|nr:hypothetical protein [Photorhabdus namnaonensis]OCA52573.1 hypothetical protein Phpb_04421 [Photorhabdus namnaonensis]